MTLTELRAALRLRLLLEDTTDSSNGSITQADGTKYINAAMRRLWADVFVSMNPDACTKRTTLTYTADAESVALPTSSPDLRGRPIREVLALGTAGGSVADRHALTCRTIEEVQNYAESGEPEVYAVGLADATIWVRPSPTEDTTLYIRYIAAPTALASNSDTPTFLPEEFHDLLVDAAALEYLESVADLGLQATIQRAYERKLKGLRVFVDDMLTQSGFRAMPARN